MNLETMVNISRIESCFCGYSSLQSSTFGDYTTLPCCSNRGGDSPSSEESWGCFSSDPLTPPLSPNVTLPAIDTFTSSFLTNPSNAAVDEFLNSNFAHNFPPVLPDLKDTCSEVFDEDSTNLHEITRKAFNQSSSKDCMWNGRNQRTRRQSRSASPGSPSCSPVSGCIDPRYVFTPFADRRKTSSPRRLQTINGLESPTDSEEEVDVVTVEKSASKSTKHSATVGVICDDRKMLSTFLQKKNGAKSQIALVATSSPQLNVTTNQQTRGRSHFKTKSPPAMSMVISGSGGTKTLNVQLKCVPVINNNSSQSTLKRKLNPSNEQASNTVVHLMRLTPTSPTDSISSEPTEEVQIPSTKRRFLSLDGVSMVSNTGINRVRNEQACVIKSEPSLTKVASFPMQTVKHEKISVVKSMEQKKATRKYTKKSVVTPYETPTSSPGSAAGDEPCSPTRKKNNGGGRASSSEEDSIRAAHNVLERQRREGLRNLYSELRMFVPEIAETEKAPKVCILTKAKEHVIALRKAAAKLQAQKLLEQEKQTLLKQRLREMAAELTSVGTSATRNAMYLKPDYTAGNDGFAVFVN